MLIYTLVEKNAFSEEKKGKRVKRYSKSKREEPRGLSLSDVKLIKV